jgi:NAD(P)-dependent dehydrogenase (short-subunit alcohol dehydrogenase family)
MSIPERPTCVVTGAGSGLGRAFCEVLAERGARVIASDVNDAGLTETVTSLAGRTEAYAQRCDVGRRDEVEALARFAEERFGSVDLLVNNAGVAVSGAIGEVPERDWRWIMDVNLWGPIHGCEVFVPGMKRRGRGHVLNVASLAGIANAPRMGPYNVTKAGLIALSETLHGELKGTGVGVSVLCPSFFPTNILRDARGGRPEEMGLAEKLMARSPIKAHDVARIALDACARGTLHILPHREGRWVWRLRRAAPQRSLDLFERMRHRLAR